jgi:hypothetical protein
VNEAGSPVKASKLAALLAENLAILAIWQFGHLAA